MGPGTGLVALVVIEYVGGCRPRTPAKRAALGSLWHCARPSHVMLPVLDLRQRPLCLLPTSQDAISHDALGQARRKHLKRPTCRRLRPLLRLGTLLLPHVPAAVKNLGE
eukprot:776679-Prymnesium_polylepis.1